MSTFVRVEHEHDPHLDWHEWIYIGPIKANKNGISNSRMFYADWQFWRCNNLECPAQAVVSNEAIRDLIDRTLR